MKITNLSGQLILVMMIPIFGSCEQWYLQNNPHFIETHNFNAVLNNNSEIKIIKFFTPWCRYCRFMKKSFDDYRAAYKSKKIHEELTVGFYEINCQEQNDICSLMKVKSYPQTKIIDKNGFLYEEIDGYFPAQTFIKLLDQILRELYMEQSQTKDQKQNQALANSNLIKNQLSQVGKKQIGKYPDNLQNQPEQIKKSVQFRLQKTSYLLENQNAQIVRQQLNQQKQDDNIRLNIIAPETNKFYSTNILQIISYILIFGIGISYFISIIPRNKNQNKAGKSISIQQVGQKIFNEQIGI